MYFTEPAPTAPPDAAARTTRINRLVLAWAVLSTACLLLTYACACVFGALIYRFARSPEHLVVQADYPLTVDEGTRFDLAFTLRNWGSTPITVTEVSLGYPGSGALLDGLIVRKAGEMLTRKSDGSGYTCDMALAPGEQRELAFNLEAARAGEFGGPVEFTTGSGSLYYDVAVGVKAP